MEVAAKETLVVVLEAGRSLMMQHHGWVEVPEEVHIPMTRCQSWGEDQMELNMSLKLSYQFGLVEAHRMDCLDEAVTAVMKIPKATGDLHV